MIACLETLPTPLTELYTTNYSTDSNDASTNLLVYEIHTQ